jgi:hypothetical protein
MFRKLKLVAAGLSLLPTLSHGQTYYSVDVTIDSLCAVDVYNGQVSYLGPIQANLDRVDLTWHQGALYAQTWGTPVGNKIYQLVTDGHYLAYGLQGGALNGGGYTVGAIGGIASNGSLLHLAYSKSNPNNDYSRSFGTVQANWEGLIAPSAPDVANTVHDIDGLGFFAGEFYGIDVLQPGPAGYNFYRTNGPGTPVDTLVAAVGPYDETTNPVDLEVFDNAWFVSVTQDGKHLIRINRNTGARGEHKALVGLQAGSVLKGIARRPNPCGRLLAVPAAASSHP